MEEIRNTDIKLFGDYAFYTLDLIETKGCCFMIFQNPIQRI